MSNFFYGKKKRKTRSFLFRKSRSNNATSILFQLGFASILLVVSILLSSLLLANLDRLNLEQFFIEFLIYFKLTFSSLYLMLLNFLFIILVSSLFLLAIFLNLASFFRIVKSVRYFITYKRKNNIIPTSSKINNY